MLPLGRISISAVNVTDRAHLLALTAADTGAGVDGEFSISYPVLEEEATQQSAVCARPAAFIDVPHALIAVNDLRQYRRQLLTSRSYLAGSALRSINLVDEREIVGLGHNHREDTVERDPIDCKSSVK